MCRESVATMPAEEITMPLPLQSPPVDSPTLADVRLTATEPPRLVEDATVPLCETPCYVDSDSGDAVPLCDCWCSLDHGMEGT